MCTFCYRPFLILALATLVCYAVTCSKAPFQSPAVSSDLSDTLTDPHDTIVDPFDLSPRPNREAEEAALWVSGQLIAPSEMYETLKHDFRLIRDQWKDSMEVWGEFTRDFGHGGDTTTGIQFIAPWHTYVITFSVSVLNSGAFINRTDSLWSHLLDTLCVDSFSYEKFDGIPDKYWFNCYFTKRLHPLVVKQYLERLEQVISVDVHGLVGDYAVMLPYPRDNQTQYFLDFTWGDCELGCTEHNVCYFGIESDSAVLIDRYCTLEYPDRPVPDWGNDLREVLGRWRTGLPPVGELEPVSP